MQNESFSPHDGPETAPAETETAKQKFERERLTRRQALKRFGMTSAMTAFALFSVDDLARMVGAAMERQAKNSKIAEQVAKEFQSAGIAMAAPYYSSTCGGATDCTDCQNYIRTSCNKVCVNTYTFPGECELEVSNCASDCASTNCPSSDNSQSEMLALQQCYDGCISGKGFPVASYPC